MARSDRRRRALFVALALVLPAGVACNGIVGLTDFEKTECPGRRCGGEAGILEGGGPDTFIPDAPREARGADPTTWAQWPMPNYDGGAKFLPHPLKYTVLDGNRIQDATTKLVWRRATLIEQLSYDDAKSRCDDLDTPGDWRLPKRIELVSLLDFGRPTDAPLVDPQFTGVKNVQVWTSSQQQTSKGVLAEPNAFWTVHFGSGLVAPLNESLVANVLCVKAK